MDPGADGVFDNGPVVYRVLVHIDGCLHPVGHFDKLRHHIGYRLSGDSLMEAINDLDYHSRWIGARKASAGELSI